MEDVKMSTVEDSDRPTEETLSTELKCDDESTDIDQLDDNEYVVFTCADCKERFWDEFELQDHQEKHQFGLICPTCGYEGRDKSGMISHSRDHLDRRSVQCLICRERLADEDRLERHLAAHARGMTECPWCCYVSATSPELKRHLDRHLRTFRVNCNYCKYYSFCEADLRAHSEVHEDDRRRAKFKKTWVRESLKSKLCTTQDVLPENLSKLLDRAVFRCGLCGEYPTSQEDFEAHLSVHIKPGFAYCPHCPFQTDDRDLIVNHVVRHLEEQDNPSV